MGTTRFHKLDFPTFDGGGDPLLFLNRCEHYFRGQRTVEEERVWLAAFPSARAGAAMVYAASTRRGHADLAPLQRAPRHAIRAANPI
jgi:hypothetical protein